MSRTILADCLIVLSALLSLLPSFLQARTWHVKPDSTGDAPTIRAAIDSAAARDTVLLAAGTFTGNGNNNIDFLGKAVVVTSQSGPGETIIDCQRNVNVGFIFQSDEDSGSVVSGLTITNSGSPQGGAIICRSNTSPVIRNNIFSSNQAGVGGAIFCSSGSAPKVMNNRFIGNAALAGGGIACQAASPIISNSIFVGNKAGFIGGNAIYCEGGASPIISHNVLVWGEIYTGAGAILCVGVGTNPVIKNTIVAFNISDGIYYYDGANPTIMCNDIYGFKSGGGHDEMCNIYEDPQFCGSIESGNFYLQSDSPCAPGNHPAGCDCGLIGALPVHCGITPVEKRTWGKVKSLYRE